MSEFMKDRFKLVITDKKTGVKTVLLTHSFNLEQNNYYQPIHHIGEAVASEMVYQGNSVTITASNVRYLVAKNKKKGKKNGKQVGKRAKKVRRRS